MHPQREASLIRISRVVINTHHSNFMKEDTNPNPLNQSDSTNTDLKNKIIIPRLLDRWGAAIVDSLILRITFFLLLLFLNYLSSVLELNYSLYLTFGLLSIAIIYYGYFVLQLCGKKRATLGQSYCKYRMTDYPSGRPASKLQIWLWVTYTLIPEIAFAFSDVLAWSLIILLGLPIFIKPYRRTVYERLAGVVMLNNQSIIHKK